MTDVKCMTCGDSGCVQEPYQRCCGRATASGECCGDPDIDFDLVPCPDCDGKVEVNTEALVEHPDNAEGKDEKV